MSKPHVVQCASCGESFTANWVNLSGLYTCHKTRCKTAVTILRRARQAMIVIQDAELNGTKVLPLDMAVVLKVNELFVVSDPLQVENGGWPCGKRFARDDWRRMYENMTFTHGTILKDRRGHLYRADGSVCDG